jgi:hypothetical protein
VFKLAMKKQRGAWEVSALVDFTLLFTHVDDGVDVKWQIPPSTQLLSCSSAV